MQAFTPFLQSGKGRNDMSGSKKLGPLTLQPQKFQNSARSNFSSKRNIDRCREKKGRFRVLVVHIVDSFAAVQTRDLASFTIVCRLRHGEARAGLLIWVTTATTATMGNMVLASIRLRET